MKRSQVQLTLQERIRILRGQVTQLTARNMKEVQEGRMERITANKQVLAMVECRELCEALEAKGLEWKDLLEMVELSDDRRGRRTIQKNLFH